MVVREQWKDLLNGYHWTLGSWKKILPGRVGTISMSRLAVCKLYLFIINIQKKIYIRVG